MREQVPHWRNTVSDIPCNPETESYQYTEHAYNYPFEQCGYCGISMPSLNAVTNEPLPALPCKVRLCPFVQPSSIFPQMGKLNPHYMRKRDSSLKAKPFATPPYLMGTVPNLLESLSYSLVQANESVANGLDKGYGDAVLYVEFIHD